MKLQNNYTTRVLEADVLDFATMGGRGIDG
jgi:hypothetical protein